MANRTALPFPRLRSLLEVMPTAEPSALDRRSRHRTQWDRMIRSARRRLTGPNRSFRRIMLENARRVSAGDYSRFYRFMIRDGLKIWKYWVNNALTCPHGGFILSVWGLYPVRLGASSCPYGVSCPIGGGTRSRRLELPSPALSNCFAVPGTDNQRLGGTHGLPADRHRESILTNWGLPRHLSCPDLTFEDRSGTS